MDKNYQKRQKMVARNIAKRTPEEEFSHSIQLTIEAMDTYKGWLKGHEYGGSISYEDMPKFADADYLIYYDYQFSHYVEVKIRYFHWEKYKQQKLPFRKYAFAYTMKNKFGKKTIYLLRCKNQIGIMPLWKEPDEVLNMIARHDRGEEKDLYAMYDINRFRTIDDNPEYFYYNKKGT